MSLLTDLLNMIKKEQDPRVLRATIGALVIAVEELADDPGAIYRQVSEALADLAEEPK